LKGLCAGCRRWADRQRAAADGLLRLGSFVYLLGHDIDMVQQDVPAMLDAVFSIIDAGEASQQRIEIPPRLMSSS